MQQRNSAGNNRNARILALIGFTILTGSMSYAQTLQPAQPKQQVYRVKPQEKTFAVVEQMPQPPMDLNQYLAENLRYPAEAVKQGIQGRVILQFVVAADGNITHVVTLRDLGGGCGQEAERVVKSMPRWTPGRQDGKAVNVYYTLPVSFKMMDADKPMNKQAPDSEPTAPNR